MIRSLWQSRAEHDAKQNANCSLSTRKEGRLILESRTITLLHLFNPEIGSIRLSEENDHCTVVDKLPHHNNGEDKREN